jgi:hypothetical protein
MKVKTVFYVLIMVLWGVTSCGEEGDDSLLLKNLEFNSALNQNGDTDSALNSITVDEIKAHLGYLASDALEGRLAGEKGEKLAMSYVAEQFNSLGIGPGNGGEYLQNFSFWFSTKNSANVLGVIPGNDPLKKKEVIVIGAHIDHLGKNYEGIYSGADDNASGVAAVLSLAKAFSKLKNTTRRTLLFMAFGAEEWGLYGSNHYCAKPVYPLNDTIYMVNLDMIGMLRNKNLEAIGADSSTWAKGLITKHCSKYDSLTCTSKNTAEGGSDHSCFSNKGIPYVFFHTGLHSCYHRVCDKADKINFAGLTDITKLTFEFTLEMAQADTSPRNSYQPVLLPHGFKDHGGSPFIGQ